jgi:hypothetical protein
MKPTLPGLIAAPFTPLLPGGGLNPGRIALVARTSPMVAPEAALAKEA